MDPSNDYLRFLLAARTKRAEPETDLNNQNSIYLGDAVYAYSDGNGIELQL